MKRTRAQDGFAMATAIIVMMIVLGLGLALLAFTDQQQHAVTREQSSESAFTLAEAALNAQIFALSVQWPTATLNTQSAFPSSCSPTSAGAAFCPNPGGSGSSGFGGGYPSGSSATCPNGAAPTDPWSSTVPNPWLTYVRDDTGGTSQLFQSSVNQTQPAYDSDGDQNVWVRATAVVNCRMSTVVAKVAEQLVALSFPTNALNANGFETSNNGNHSNAIFDNEPGAVIGSISVRCTGLQGPPGAGTQCTNYVSGQVQSETWASPPVGSSALSNSQLQGLKLQAQANGTYHPPNDCNVPSLTGAVVYVEGPCNLSFQGSSVFNSASSPGILIIKSGTLYLDGTVQYYGIVYDVNSQGCPSASSSYCLNGSGDVVEVHGNAVVQGAIDVDGNGTVRLGSSGNGSGTGNLVYDGTEFDQLKTYAGAAEVPNTFRQLPQGQ
jgi:type II secretory pathway pseudopilin PulG